VRIVDTPTTRQALAFAPLIEALRALFVQGCELPSRHSHHIVVPGGAAGTVLLMPAWRSGQRFGLKTVAVFPGNAARGLPALHATYTLFDATTGVPLAQLDGAEITSRRTAAASALAASYLARGDASHLLIVGAGRVGSLLAQAMHAVRPLRHVTVWNRDALRAEALASSLLTQGFNARASTDLEHATGEADIVSCATLSSAALIHGAWLRPGVHLDLIGSFTPTMRESDASCFARARVFIDTAEALAKSGDVLQAIAEGAFSGEQVQGTLEQLCRGERCGRSAAAQITLFKSVGTALEDLAAAELVWDALERAGT
jgi:ornithine cyclodeaminase/alanine dehydrogenase-like protein (mu-crystallin family)